MRQVSCRRQVAPCARPATVVSAAACTRPAGLGVAGLVAAWRDYADAWGARVGVAQPEQLDVWPVAVLVWFSDDEELAAHLTG